MHDIEQHPTSLLGILHLSRTWCISWGFLGDTGTCLGHFYSSINLLATSCQRLDPWCPIRSADKEWQYWSGSMKWWHRNHRQASAVFFPLVVPFPSGGFLGARLFHSSGLQSIVCMGATDSILQAEVSGLHLQESFPIAFSPEPLLGWWQ